MLCSAFNLLPHPTALLITIATTGAASPTLALASVGSADTTLVMADQYTLDDLGSSHDLNMVGRKGYCAMRESCGPKNYISKPLPCPSNEPASEVRGLRYIPKASSPIGGRMALTATFSSPCAAKNSQKVRRAVTRIK